jgi:HEAT repeats
MKKKITIEKELQAIHDMIPPWDWPDTTGKLIHQVLHDRSSDLPVRLLAAEMAGNLVIINDNFAKMLLAITLESNNEAEELKCKSVISLGPLLEYVDMSGFDDSDDILVAEETFDEILAALKKAYHDANVPKAVRRRILEASIRAPRDWHSGAVRAAFASNDEEWQLTAVFCMKEIKGFDRQILQALESNNHDIRCHAILAAGEWELKNAQLSILSLLSEPDLDKWTLLAAIEAAASIDLFSASTALEMLVSSDDEDVAEAAADALGFPETDEFDDLDENDW